MDVIYGSPLVGASDDDDDDGAGERGGMGIMLRDEGEGGFLSDTMRGK